MEFTRVTFTMFNAVRKCDCNDRLFISACPGRGARGERQGGAGDRDSGYSGLSGEMTPAVLGCVRRRVDRRICVLSWKNAGVAAFTLRRGACLWRTELISEQQSGVWPSGFKPKDG